jgi:hypothetical protein
MKPTLLCFAFPFLLYACQRKLKQQDTKTELKKTMAQYLEDRQIQNHTGLHFDVLDVVYFQDSTFYLCKFKVKMTLPDGHDTTGDMKFKILKDMTTVLPPDSK